MKSVTDVKWCPDKDRSEEKKAAKKAEGKQIQRPTGGCRQREGKWIYVLVRQIVAAVSRADR